MTLTRRNFVRTMGLATGALGGVGNAWRDAPRGASGAGANGLGWLPARRPRGPMA